MKKYLRVLVETIFQLTNILFRIGVICRIPYALHVANPPSLPFPQKTANLAVCEGGRGKA